MGVPASFRRFVRKPLSLGEHDAAVTEQSETLWSEARFDMIAVLSIDNIGGCYSYQSVVVEILGNLANPRAIPVLLECLKEMNPAIQAKTIAALGDFKAPSTIDALLPFLDAGDGLLDTEAIASLALIGTDRIPGNKVYRTSQFTHTQPPETTAHALCELQIIQAGS